MLGHGCSPVNLLHIFRTPFPRSTTRCLCLNIVIVKNVASLYQVAFSRISPIYASKLSILISWSNIESIHYVKCMHNSSANTNMEVYKDQPSSLNDMVYDFQKKS